MTWYRTIRKPQNCAMARTEIAPRPGVWASNIGLGNYPICSMAKSTLLLTNFHFPLNSRAETVRWQLIEDAPRPAAWKPTLYPLSDDILWLNQPSKLTFYYTLLIVQPTPSTIGFLLTRHVRLPARMAYSYDSWLTNHHSAFLLSGEHLIKHVINLLFNILEPN